MPVDIDGTTKLIISQIETVETQLNDELRSLLGDPRYAFRTGRLRNLLDQIDAAKDDIHVAAKDWVNGPFRDAYVLSATEAAARLGANFDWTQFHREAFTMLATDTFSDVLDATQYMGDDVKKLVRTLGKAHAVKGELAGRTALQSAKALRDDLMKRGLTAVTYKNGSQHGLGEFSRMLMRTKTALARNLGSMVQYKQLGVKYLEAVDGLGCGLVNHSDPPVADGMVLPANEAWGYPISHPNCVRDWLPRVDITSADQVSSTGSLVETSRWEDQRRFQAYMDQQKALRHSQVASRRPREGRSPRIPRILPRRAQRIHTGGRTPTPAELRALGGPTPDGVLDTETFWKRAGVWHPERQKLHDQIVDDFVGDIPAATGHPTVTMTGGGPVSGKSVMIDAAPDRFPGADVSVHVDADAVKRYLPEYRELVQPGRNPGGSINWDDIDPKRPGFDPRAAAFTQKESSEVSKRIITEALGRDQNILFDSVGDSGIEKLGEKIDQVHAAGHHVVAEYATNDVALAERLSADRAVRTGRDVPLDYLREAHTDVTDTFIDALRQGTFDEATLWDTNVFQQPRQVLRWDGQRLVIIDDALFGDFVAKGTRSEREVRALLEDVLDPNAAAVKKAKRSAAAKKAAATRAHNKAAVQP